MRPSQTDTRQGAKMNGPGRAGNSRCGEMNVAVAQLGRNWLARATCFSLAGLGRGRLKARNCSVMNNSSHCQADRYPLSWLAG